MASGDDADKAPQLARKTPPIIRSLSQDALCISDQYCRGLVGGEIKRTQQIEVEFGKSTRSLWKSTFKTSCHPLYSTDLFGTGNADAGEGLYSDGWRRGAVLNSPYTAGPDNVARVVGLLQSAQESSCV